MAYFRCQQGSSSGGAGATITVTYDSSFYNKTMTCTNGTKTYTKTTTSSGSTTFNVSDEGTWTITCNGVSRTVNVVLSYSTQMAITKTITIYGAKEDYITYTDATGSKVCQFASGATSKSVSITFIPNQSITFKSMVAKNPNNLSANFTKTVTMTKSTTTIDMMPVARSKVLYWWGWKNKTFTYVKDQDASVPAEQTQGVYLSSENGTVWGSIVYFPDANFTFNGTKAKCIFTNNITVSGGAVDVSLVSGSGAFGINTLNVTGYTDIQTKNYTTVISNTLDIITLDLTISSGRIGYFQTTRGSNSKAHNTLRAIWLE